MKLADLTWPDVEKMDRDTVVIFPLAALEQHSRHLPFFTDTILCEAVVARIESALPSDVLLLPVQWLGASAHHLGMAGTLTAEIETYFHMICEPLRCLLGAGFRRVLVVNGHGGNIDSFHLALRQLATEFPQALLAGASYWDFASAEIAGILEGEKKAVGHACELETSLMLHVRPELVRHDEIHDGEVGLKPNHLRSLYVPLDMKRQTPHGGTGQPSLATAAKGNALLDAIVSRAIEGVESLRRKIIS